MGYFTVKVREVAYGEKGFEIGVFGTWSTRSLRYLSFRQTVSTRLNNGIILMFLSTLDYYCMCPLMHTVFNPHALSFELSLHFLHPSHTESVVTPDAQHTVFLV